MKKMCWFLIFTIIFLVGCDTSSYKSNLETCVETNKEIVTPYVSVPQLCFYSYNEYLEFIESNRVPENFVKYETLSCFGAFESLVILSDGINNDFSSYFYSFTDEYNCKVSMYVDHGDPLPSEEENRMYVSNVNDKNMRNLTSESDGSTIYVSNGLEYIYVDGRLLGVKWRESDSDIVYCVVMSRTPDNFKTMLLSYYPENIDSATGKLLNTQTAQEVVNNIDKAYANQ